MVGDFLDSLKLRTFFNRIFVQASKFQTFHSGLETWRVIFGGGWRLNEVTFSDKSCSIIRLDGFEMSFILFWGFGTESISGRYT